MEKVKFYFRKATLPKLDKTFGLRRVLSSKVLSDWIDRGKTIKLTDFEQQSCAYSQMLLLENTDSWQVKCSMKINTHFMAVMSLASIGIL